MNEQQRNYTIKEIERYNDTTDDLYFKVNRNAFFAFCGVALAVAIFAINGGEFTGSETTDNLVGVSSAGLAAYNSIKAVQRICEKASLEHTVRVLEHNLAMDELDKPKQLVKMPVKQQVSNE